MGRGTRRNRDYEAGRVRRPPSGPGGGPARGGRPSRPHGRRRGGHLPDGRAGRTGSRPMRPASPPIGRDDASGQSSRRGVTRPVTPLPSTIAWHRPRQRRSARPACGRARSRRFANGARCTRADTSSNAIRAARAASRDPPPRRCVLHQFRPGCTVVIRRRCATSMCPPVIRGTLHATTGHRRDCLHAVTRIDRSSLRDHRSSRGPRIHPGEGLNATERLQPERS